MLKATVTSIQQKINHKNIVTVIKSWSPRRTFANQLFDVLMLIGDRPFSGKHNQPATPD